MAVEKKAKWKVFKAEKSLHITLINLYTRMNKEWKIIKTQPNYTVKQI